MPRCHIALGGNLGNVSAVFDQALDRIRAVPGNSVVTVSRYYETAAVGRQAGKKFLNAAAEIETRLAPLALLDFLQTIELDLGRTRTTHWGPRTLDLDILFYSSEIIELPRLVVPHPAAWYRRFVLDPLVDIAPQFVHPQRLADIATLRQRLLPRPLVAALAGGSAETKTALIRSLQPAFSAVEFVDWNAAVPSTSHPNREPALTFWLGPGDHARDLPAIEFRDLPVISRIDVSQVHEPIEDFVQSVLMSALG